ncbi:uncharacterized protein LOC132818637 [Hemiscyllium ocellatum]|uniref:uncharacterized protein LOC132818637 n=1 Tax=Hemiscyllium ocellatum TaxID=170820 RepID=UPI0029672AE1|nr:uncharacterized protein LOC132818637 [Hemiscyllium ocellatum]
MDDVAVFCSDPLSVRRLMCICDQFERASGAKVNRGKNEAMLFGNWADQSSIPFTVRTDHLKVLGIWFGGAGACAKSWEERISKVRQKLGRWKLRSLSITGKNLVIRCEALSLLLYVSQVWPIPRTCAAAVTRATFQFIWRSKMDPVRRDSLYKDLGNGGKNTPNATLTLMATFVCGCIKLCQDPRYANTKCHYVLRFYLSPVLRRMGLASLPRNAPSSWTIPYHLSFVEKFLKKNTFDHKSIRKWSARSVLETLREKESADPVEWFPEQTVKAIWQNASSPERSNKHQNMAWLVVRRALPVRSFMHAQTLSRTTRCPRSGCGGDETVTHLLLECAYAEEVWRGMQWCLSRFVPSSAMTRDSVLYGLFPRTHTETNINCAWRIINLVKDALWAVRNLLIFQLKELTPTECCRLAHSKVQDYVLRDALKLGAAAAKARWGKTTV